MLCDVESAKPTGTGGLEAMVVLGRLKNNKAMMVAFALSSLLMALFIFCQFHAILLTLLTVWLICGKKCCENGKSLLYNAYIFTTNRIKLINDVSLAWLNASR